MPHPKNNKFKKKLENNKPNKTDDEPKVEDSPKSSEETDTDEA